MPEVETASIQVANIAMLTLQRLAFNLWSQVKFANAVRSNVDKEIIIS